MYSGKIIRSPFALVVPRETFVDLILRRDENYDVTEKHGVAVVTARTNEKPERIFARESKKEERGQGKLKVRKKCERLHRSATTRIELATDRFRSTRITRRLKRMKQKEKVGKGI